jgi:FAD/FMN-containing dehydrogenase
MTKIQIPEILITADDPRFDDARRAWNLTVDQRPAAVALPHNAGELAAAVTHATAAGLRVAVQGTGHGATALGSLEAAVLVKTSAMRGVTIAPMARLARVEAGALWGDVVRPAAEHGLVPLAGSSHDVGVVGYTLGGGLSALSRLHGLAAHSVQAAEVVTGDGRLIRVDARHEPELFWALRGGGGSFAAVTALEIRLFPFREATAGLLFFPLERAGEVLRAWREWVADVPDEMASCGRLLRLPPLPDLPEPLRGRSFAVVEAVHLGSAADAGRLLTPLRRLGPVRDTTGPTSPHDLLTIHMDPPGPVPGVAEGMLLDELPSEAIDAMLVAAGPGLSSQLVSVELRHLGGALHRPAADSALAKLDAPFLAAAAGTAPDAAAAQAAQAQIGQVADALAPWRAARDLMNFTGRGTDAARFFPPGVLERLRHVKQAYDPAGVFQASHPVSRGGGTNTQPGGHHGNQPQ